MAHNKIHKLKLHVNVKIQNVLKNIVIVFKVVKFVILNVFVLIVKMMIQILIFKDLMYNRMLKKNY